MKTTAILAATLLFAACQQETTTSSTVGNTTTVSSSTTKTETAAMPVTVDTAATAQAKENVKDALKKAEEKTGTALEKAGGTLKNDAKKH